MNRTILISLGRVSSVEWQANRDREKDMKKTITVVALCAILFALSLSAEAQQPKKIPRIGYLQAPPSSAVAPRTDAFRQGLRELGYVEGKDIVIEYRYAEGKPDRPLRSRRS